MVAPGARAMSTEQECALLHELDEQYGTDPRSPLHHDARCPVHVPRDWQHPAAVIAALVRTLTG